MTDNEKPKEGTYPNSVVSKAGHISEEALKKTVREASLSADRSKWFIATIVLAIVVAIQFIQNSSLASKLDENYKVAWVKMYKTGTWEVDIFEDDLNMEVLPATIDSLLSQWVERRFSELPETIRGDLGFANMFMATHVSREFLDPEGFNAPQKVVDVQKCKDCSRVKYEVGPIDHFDANTGNFGGAEDRVYQTNVFVDRVAGIGSTAQRDKRIVRIKWRLLTPSELKVRVNQEGGQNWLRYNPIGLEVLGYEELDDRSDNLKGS